MDSAGPVPGPVDRRGSVSGKKCRNLRGMAGTGDRRTGKKRRKDPGHPADGRHGRRPSLEKLQVLEGSIDALKDPNAKAIAIAVDTDDYGNPLGAESCPRPGEKVTVTYTDEWYYEDSRDRRAGDRRHAGRIYPVSYRKKAMTWNIRYVLWLRFPIRYLSVQRLCSEWKRSWGRRSWKRTAARSCILSFICLTLRIRKRNRRRKAFLRN